MRVGRPRTAVRSKARRRQGACAPRPLRRLRRRPAVAPRTQRDAQCRPLRLDGALSSWKTQLHASRIDAFGRDCNFRVSSSAGRPPCGGLRQSAVSKVKVRVPFPDTDLRSPIVEGASARRESSLRHVFHGRPFDLLALVGVPLYWCSAGYVSGRRSAAAAALAFDQPAAHSSATNYGTRGLLSGKHSPFCTQTLCWQL